MFFGILVVGSEQEFGLISEGIPCGVIWEEDQKEITYLRAQSEFKGHWASLESISVGPDYKFKPGILGTRYLIFTAY